MTSATSPGAAGPVTPPEDKLIMRLGAGTWGIGVTVGALSALLGLAILAWPEATIRVVAVLFGLKLIAHGVYRIVQAVVVDEAAATVRVLFTLLGVLSLAFGVIVLRHQFQTVELLAMLFGLFWLIGGVVELVTVLGARGTSGRGWKAALAILSVVAGLVVLAYPGISLTALTWLLGLWLFTWGLLTVALTLWIRHADKQQVQLG